MNVYVESNFVLEYALQQEEFDSCADIIRLATDGLINLVIPAFSLAEPHQAIFGRAKIRERLAGDLRSHLRELGRSKPHRGIPATFDALVAALVASAQFEHEGIRRATADLLRVAEVIPLNEGTLRSAAAIEQRYCPEGQDAIVLAFILAHLEATAPPESCFLNRNTKDFDDPDIRDELERLRCKFFGKFAPALGYLLNRLGR